MGRYDWQAAFMIRIESMDVQHRLIFERMAAVEVGADNTQGGEHLQTAVEALEQCCKMHFFDEERLMERRHFPSAPDHKGEHDRFVQALEEMQGLAPDQVVSRLIAFREGFTEHIFSNDMHYAEFFLKRDGM